MNTLRRHEMSLAIIELLYFAYDIDMDVFVLKCSKYPVRCLIVFSDCVWSFGLFSLLLLCPLPVIALTHKLTHLQARRRWERFEENPEFLSQVFGATYSGCDLEYDARISIQLFGATH